MSSLRGIVAMIVVLLLGATGGYLWAIRGVDRLSATSAGVEPAANQRPAPETQVLYWHDPMKPEVRFDKPGKSPYMNMPLVPVYASGAAAAGGVAVSPGMRQSLGIRLGRVEQSAEAHSLAAVGSVAYDEHHTTVVQARAAGYVTRLFVRAMLDRVRRGQPLADVTVPAWVEAQGEYLALLNADPVGSSELRDAARNRLRLLGVPDSAVRTLEQQRKVVASVTLTAPIEGVVSELGVREGASFAEGALLFRINGLATVWVNAQLPEAQAARIAAGGAAEIQASAWPGQRFAGRVEALLPQLDMATRTLTARIMVDNRSGRLAPGMFVTANLVDRQTAAQLWVPSEAVIATGLRNVVIRVRDDGGFDAVDVTTGSESGGRTAIIAGLAAGESVVTSGQFLIDSEASLKSALNRLSAGPTP